MNALFDYCVSKCAIQNIMCEVISDFPYDVQITAEIITDNTKPISQIYFCTECSERSRRVIKEGIIFSFTLDQNVFYKHL